jgi:predicted enzyme related to lactoylglutathione lyase
MQGRVEANSRLYDSIPHTGLNPRNRSAEDVELFRDDAFGGSRSAMSDVIEGMEAVSIHVRDIERARKFYSEVLGLKEASFTPAASRAAYAIPGTTTLLTMHIQGEGEGGRPPGTVSGVIFSHRDPRAACEEIRKRGGSIVDEPKTFETPLGVQTRGVFADPDGNEFVIRHLEKGPTPASS